MFNANTRQLGIALGNVGHALFGIHAVVGAVIVFVKFVRIKIGVLFEKPVFHVKIREGI